MHKQLRSESGFTLAELLVATVVTLMVVGAALGTFTDAVRVTDAARETSDTNQSLEVATALLIRDFIQAGQGIPLGGISIPSGAGAQLVERPSPAGGTLTFPGGTEVISSVFPGGGLGPVVNGVTTDLVTILYADPTLPTMPVVVSADGTSMTVDASVDITGADGLREGDLIMFKGTAVAGSALHMITSVSGGQSVTFASGDDMNLNQPGAAQGTVRNLFNPGDPTVPHPTARRVTMITYYIDNTTDPALPRLVRQLNYGDRLAIALGIENIQFTFDLVDDLTNPTNIETPAAPNSANQIRKANLFLAGRSIQVNPRTRQYFRNTVATQVSLRSLAFRSRYSAED
jgi:type II secretory pathway pseudopilin PulG